MGLHRGAGGFFHRLGIALLLGPPFGNAPAVRQIAMQRIMGRGLVGHDVGARPACLHALHQFRENVCGIAQKANGLGFACFGPFRNQGQSLIERLGLGIEVSGAQAEIDAGFIALDSKAAGARHDSRQRLRTAHATKAAGENPFAL